MKRKPATRVFQHFPRWRSGHAEPMRRSVGTRPRSETTRTRRQRKENAIRVDSRLFAVGFLLCPHPTNSFPIWIKMPFPKICCKLPTNHTEFILFGIQYVSRGRHTAKDPSPDIGIEYHTNTIYIRLGYTERALSNVCRLRYNGRSTDLPAGKNSPQQYPIGYDTI